MIQTAFLTVKIIKKILVYHIHHRIQRACLIEVSVKILNKFENSIIPALWIAGKCTYTTIGDFYAILHNLNQIGTLNKADITALGNNHL